MPPTEEGLMIRARLPDGTLATYIGPDGDNYVVRLDTGEYTTVPEMAPEFDTIQPAWITGIPQPDGTFAIASWPNQETALSKVKAQWATYRQMIPLARIIHHQGLIVIADTTGQPLRSTLP